MFTTRPEILGTTGVVASTHWLASAAGMAILEAGGNAFDAAVATGFALQVVEPHLNGPGGEVPIILRAAGRGRIEVICGQGVAPAGATIEHYRGLGLDLVPGSGLLATVVPGAFDAWMLLLRDYGTLSLREVLRHAIDYAGGGYPLVPRISEAIAEVAVFFRREWPSSAALYLPDDAPPKAGSLFRNRVLGETYRRLLEEAEAVGGERERQIEAARRAWSQGFVAEAVDSFCRENAVMDTSGERHFGVLTGEDMARWQAGIEAPLTLDYHGYTFCKPGPWSQGPVFLQQLSLLAGFDLGAMDPLGAEFVHSVIECAKLAFADREAYYGDPNFVQVPCERLLSEDYAGARRRLVGDTASADLRPGRIEGFEGRLAEFRTAGEVATEAAFGAGEPTVQGDQSAPGDTCHLDVIAGHPRAGFLP
jgi:gamma-glutamyltranspeptidase/glutathione hydrolase